MLLNQYGLWKWNHTSPSREADGDDEPPETERGYWSLVKSATEEDIFEELGIDFIEPSRRNFSFISARSRKKRGVAPF
jgi:DNA polymerase beta